MTTPDVTGKLNTPAASTQSSGSVTALEFLKSGWRNRLELLRYEQHGDHVCGIKWGESYRAHIQEIRRRCYKSLNKKSSESAGQKTES